MLTITAANRQCCQLSVLPSVPTVMASAATNSVLAAYGGDGSPPNSVYEFIIGESRETREAKIDTLQPDELEAVLYAFEQITSAREVPVEDPHPLIWWMATDEMEVENEDAQRHSDDWRLRVWHVPDGGILYEFTGWPGDMEDGPGIYRGVDDVLSTVYWVIDGQIEGCHGYELPDDELSASRGLQI